MALSLVVVIMGWIVREDVDLLLRWMYVMLGLGIGSIVLMSVYSLAQNPKGALQGLIGLVAIVVVIGIAWAFSSGAPVTTPTSEYTDSFLLKLTDTTLYSMYALLAAAVLAIVVGEVRNVFK
jgi:hypothetical protein